VFEHPVRDRRAERREETRAEILEAAQLMKERGKPRRTRRLSAWGRSHRWHGREAGVLYDETTRTLLCGDLFTIGGAYAPRTSDDIVAPAIATEDAMSYSSLAPGSGTMLRRLAELDVATLALMHGPAFDGGGDCGGALRDLAADVDARIAAAG
jgi:hypothetical protein